LVAIFNRTQDYQNGMEVDINYYITPFMTENSPISQAEIKGMRTGALNVSQIG